MARTPVTEEIGPWVVAIDNPFLVDDKSIWSGRMTRIAEGEAFGGAHSPGAGQPDQSGRPPDCTEEPNPDGLRNAAVTTTVMGRKSVSGSTHPGNN